MKNLILLQNFNIIPEFFLGLSLIYIVLYSTIICCYKKYYNLIFSSIVNLSILVLFFVTFLFYNDTHICLNFTNFFNTIISDNLSFFSKFLIALCSLCFLFFFQQSLKFQKINHFEYVLLLLFALLGVFLLCSSNDLITAYLSIELQSLVFFVLAAFKKNSAFSVEAGLKYFVLGAFTTSLFLFGSSFVYGLTGTTNFEDLKDLCLISTDELYILNQYNNISELVLESFIYACIIKIFESNNFYFFNKKETKIILSEINNIINTCDFSNKKKFNIIEELFFGMTHNQILFEIMPNCKETLNYQSYIFEKIKKTLFYLDCYFTYITEKISQNNLNENNENVLILLSQNVYECELYNCIQLVEFVNFLPIFCCFNTTQDFVIDNIVTENLLIKIFLIFIMLSIFFKLAVVPFHLWVPDIYENSPTISTAFFAIIPKLSILIFFIRLFYCSFNSFFFFWQYCLILLSILSIFVGAISAVEQRKLKSLLAYSAIGHIGYILIAFSCGSLDGIQMVLYYIFIYMLSGLSVWSIFLLFNLKTSYTKKYNKDLTDFVLFFKSNNTIAFFFSIVLLSLAGVPPLVGFIVKMNIFLVAIEFNLYFVAILSILCSVISTFYYLRIIKILYFEKKLVGNLFYPVNTENSILILGLIFLLIFFFFNPTLIYLSIYKTIFIF